MTMNEFEQNPANQQLPPAFNQPQAPQNQAPDPISTFGRPMMSFIETVKTCVIDKYCCFTGRARRSEFWWFYLAQQILGSVVGWIAMGIYLKNHTMFDYINDPITFLTSPAMIIMGIYCLIMLLPTLGAMVRRLHDTNRSGKWLLMLLLSVIPIAGTIIVLVFAIILIVWMAQDSQRTENKYGPSPKYQ